MFSVLHPQARHSGRLKPFAIRGVRKLPSLPGAFRADSSQGLVDVHDDKFSDGSNGSKATSFSRMSIQLPSTNCAKHQMEALRGMGLGNLRAKGACKQHIWTFVSPSVSNPRPKDSIPKIFPTFHPTPGDAYSASQFIALLFLSPNISTFVGSSYVGKINRAVNRT